MRLGFFSISFPGVNSLLFERHFCPLLLSHFLRSFGILHLTVDSSLQCQARFLENPCPQCGPASSGLFSGLSETLQMSPSGLREYQSRLNNLSQIIENGVPKPSCNQLNCRPHHSEECHGFFSYFIAEAVGSQVGSSVSGMLHYLFNSVACLYFAFCSRKARHDILF